MPLTDIGADWKMRFNSVTSVDIALPTHMQNKDFKIVINGLVGLLSYYTYLRFNGTFNINNYRTLTGVGGYNGTNGLLFPYGTDIQNRKFIHVSASMEVVRNKNYIAITHSRLTSGGDIFNTTATRSAVNNTGVVFAMNPTLHNVEDVAIPSITIHFGTSQSNLKNGFTVKLMEVV